MSMIFLVADDDPNVRLISQRALANSDLKAEFKFVPNGREAIQWLAGESIYAERGVFPLPQAVIIDLKMRHIDGFEVIRYVRAHPTLKQLPIIVYTNSSMASDMEQATALGANAYIIKTSTGDELINCMRLLAPRKQPGQ